MKAATKKRAAWILGIAAAAAAVGGAVLIGEKAAKASTPAAPQNLLSPITDAGTVRYYQNGVAQALADPAKNQIPGLTAASYGPADVDGNPANSRWMATLSTFQTYANSQRPWTAPTMPAGFPTALRTDGILDYATAVMLQNF